MSSGAAGPSCPEGFVAFTRAEWSALAGPDPTAERPVSDAPVAGVPADELLAVYRPLCRLLAAMASGSPGDPPWTTEFLGSGEKARSPFVVGISGSVAVGKSTIAHALGEALMGSTGPVEILSTDAFLYTNDELAARGLSARKGFPETYDLPALLSALTAIRSGAEVEVPVYSHRRYDIVPGRRAVIRAPAVLVVEGLNVLQSGRDPSSTVGGGAARVGSLVSDHLDWSIYVDAAVADLERWHCERLLALRSAAVPDDAGFLGWFCSLSEPEARAVARASWTEVNAVNLRDHIAPSRSRARTILHKGGDHRVSHVFVRPD